MGQSTKYLTNTSQNCKGYKKKNRERRRNYHSQEEPEEIQQLNAIQCTGWFPGTEKELGISYFIY